MPHCLPYSSVCSPSFLRICNSEEKGQGISNPHPQTSRLQICLNKDKKLRINTLKTSGLQIRLNSPSKIEGV